MSKIVIVGGVAAGASAAARLRRLDEQVEIVLLERGPYISYANCGLPYHLGQVIPERETLLVMPSERMKARFNIDVRVLSEVTAIDPAAKSLTVRTHDGQSYIESYDKLLLAPGSSPIMMNLPGSDDPAILRLWTIPDMDAVLKRVDAGAKRAVVVGAGFIGLEVAENLRLRGLEVTIVELVDQVLPTIDKEMSSYLAQELTNHGIRLELGRKVTAFKRSGDLKAVLDDGRELAADFVIMSVGVKPNSELAQAAGLQVGPRKHIMVNAELQTSNPDIYAAGDVIEVVDPVTGLPTAIPLAGPANRQGRIVADNLVGGHSTYRGTFGSAILKVGNLSAASIGLTERRLKQLKMPYQKIYAHPASNASYYPGGAQMHLKLLFGADGTILGAQGVGHKGVDKRIDVIGVAMQFGKKVRDLAEVELAYAPPFNSAKDPVNFLGMMASNMLDGKSAVIYADEIPASAKVIDVSEPAEFEIGAIPGSVNIPLGQLRLRLGELDKQTQYVSTCRVGLRGYVAERVLRQNGFKVANLSGGYLTWKSYHAALQVPAGTAPVAPTCLSASMMKEAMKDALNKAGPDDGLPMAPKKMVDVRALACPGPVVRLKQEMDGLANGETLQLTASVSFAPDLNSWIASSGNELISQTITDQHLVALIMKRSSEDARVTRQSTSDQAAIILFSNDLDKALAALIIACGMAAAGQKVGVFFTFWGLSVLRKNPAPSVAKSLLSTMFGWMLPKGAQKLALSKMHMAGMGTEMMKYVMRQQNVPTLQELMVQAKGMGVKFIACEMAMNVMGLTREELVEIDDVAGIASFAEMAKQSGTTLFI
jgi:NADPH-dependent 2,4-dienoyl-CoA reductase/sulfur reductase-like enzyme/peroxiredoxin family protein/rhodanese-related sulfurtransferase/TusA-related sulfurtransferase